MQELELRKFAFYANISTEKCDDRTCEEVKIWLPMPISAILATVSEFSKKTSK